ncbi:hypothetical protein N0V95_003276 [Ascochyta clinopodiicola]|nr:hypothetical protein N0V95_003276 [Ascochyta clinopodiicola]
MGNPERSLDAPSIAIVGGGIAGVTLTIGLLAHCPSLRINLYESASAFGEIGAGVGFQPVMVRTMAMIDPRIAAAFEKCIRGNEETDPPTWFTVRVSDQRKKDVIIGKDLFDIPARAGTRGGVHRAHFLAELVKLVPEGIAQFGKRLVEITKADDSSVVAFSSRPTWTDSDWVVQTSREEMLKDYEHWSPKIWKEQMLSWLDDIEIEQNGSYHDILVDYSSP